MEPIEAFAYYKLGKLSGDKIVILATEWLEKDIYTENLCELCLISNPIMSEVGPLFEKTMKDLEIQELSKLEAANFVIRNILNQIVRNEIGPDEGASFLYWDIHHQLENEIPDKNYLGDNLGLEHIFCWLREIWDCKDGSALFYHEDLPRNEAEKKFKEYLIDEANKILNEDRSG